MVKTIKNVRFIKNNSKGETINLVILDTTDGKASIVRPAAAFLQDLDNSFLVDGVKSIRSPQVRAIMRDLKGATVTGSITHHTKGEKWTVTEDSSVITDPSHPEYGSVAVGDQMEYQNDGTRVDGFLEIRPTEVVMARKENALALAEMTASLSGAFVDTDTAPTTAAAVSAEGSFDPTAIPADLVEQAATETN